MAARGWLKAAAAAFQLYMMIWSRKAMRENKAAANQIADHEIFFSFLMEPGA
jgi:hypothetical protein